MNKNNYELAVEKFDEEQMERINEILEKDFNMELVEGEVAKVTELIESWTRALDLPELEGSKEYNLEILEQLKRFRSYYAIRSEDINSGIFGQAYAIVDFYGGFVGLVRTV